MRIIEGNTGIVRIEIDGSLPDGALRQVAYQRYLAFIDRVAAADIIDPEKAYEFYQKETLDMRLSDVKRLHVASQGLYLSGDSVTRWADLSLEADDMTFSDNHPSYSHRGVLVAEGLDLGDLPASIATVGTGTLTRVPRHYLLVGYAPVKAVQVSGSTLRILSGTVIYEFQNVGMQGSAALSPGAYEAVMMDEATLSSDQQIARYFEALTRGTSIAVPAGELTIERDVDFQMTGIEWDQHASATALSVVTDLSPARGVEWDMDDPSTILTEIQR